MQRAIVVFFICVGSPFMGGCTKLMYGLPHPHSELTAPTFCLYDAWADKYASPVPIYRVRVTRVNPVNDQPIAWKAFSPRRISGIDQVAWEIEYAPDDKSKPFHPFSCLTYGKAPKGYVEHIAAQPLIPERLYRVQILPKGITPMSWVYFVIRADSTGRPIQLEYKCGPDRDHIYVITPQ